MAGWCPCLPSSTLAVAALVEGVAAEGAPAQHDEHGEDDQHPGPPGQPAQGGRIVGATEVVA